MSLALFWLEVQKLLKRRLFLILLGLLIGLELFVFAGGTLIFNFLSDPVLQDILKTNLTFPGGLSVALALSTNLGGLFLLILAADVVNSEYNWRTVHLYLSHGVSRVMLLTTRGLALVIPALLFVLLPLLLALLFVLILTLPLGGTFRTEGIEWGGFFLQTARTMLYLVPFTTFPLLLGTLSRSMPITIILSLLYIFIVEPVIKTVGNLLGQPLAQLTPYLPFQLTNALLGQGDGGVQMGPDGNIIPIETLDPNLAGAILLIWILGFWGVSLLAFGRQDFTG